MKLSPPFGFLRLFAGANLRLIGRLLSDQGMKHWRGYAFALGVTMIVAWTTTMSAWIIARCGALGNAATTKPKWRGRGGVRPRAANRSASCGEGRGARDVRSARPSVNSLKSSAAPPVRAVRMDFVNSPV